MNKPRDLQNRGGSVLYPVLQHWQNTGTEFWDPQPRRVPISMKFTWTSSRKADDYSELREVHKVEHFIFHQVNASLTTPRNRIYMSHQKNWKIHHDRGFSKNPAQ
jgi:hypothetical protein